MADVKDINNGITEESAESSSLQLSVRASLTPEAAWQAVRGQLQMEMPKATFDTWVRDADFLDFEDGLFIIGVQNGYAREWLEGRLTITISRLLGGITGNSCEVRFVVHQYASRNTQELLEERESSLQIAFATTIASIKSQISLSDFERHIKHLRLDMPGEDQESCTVIAPDRETVLWINRYLRPQFETHFKASYGSEISLRFEAISSEDPLRGTSVSETIELYTPLVRLREIFQKENLGHRFPRYLLRWMPYIGTNAFWTLIAMRQAHFMQHHCLPEHGRRIQVSLQELASIIGADRKMIIAHRDSGLLAPFIEHFPTEKYVVTAPGKVHRSAHEYAFRDIVPFIPIDLQHLTAFLLEYGFPQNPVDALNQALKTDPKKLLATELLKKEGSALSLGEHIPLAKHLLALCNQGLSTPQRAKVLGLIERLQNHIVDGLGHEFVSLYFLKHWLPRIGHAGAAFALFCRQKIYINPNDGEYREYWQLANGLEDLAPIATQMGKSLKTLKSYVPQIEHEGRKSPGRRRSRTQAIDNNKRSERLQRRKREMSHFIYRAVKKPDGKLRLHISRLDPLLPDHQHEYDAALLLVAHFFGQYGLDYTEADVNEFLAIIEDSQIFSPLSKSHIRNIGKSHIRTISKSHIRNNSKSYIWNNSKSHIRTISKSHLGNISKSHIRNNFLKTLNLPQFKHLTANRLRNYLINQLQETPDASRKQQSIRWIQNVGDVWEENHIKQCKLFSQKEREELLAKEATAQEIIAWVLYCYSEKGKGIKHPNKFLLSRFNGDKSQGPSPGPGFERLARLGPAKLQRLLRNQSMMSTGMEFKGKPAGKTDWESLMTPLRDSQAYIEFIEILGLGNENG